jgi:hypothetical protein
LRLQGHAPSPWHRDNPGDGPWSSKRLLSAQSRSWPEPANDCFRDRRPRSPMTWTGRERLWLSGHQASDSTRGVTAWRPMDHCTAERSWNRWPSCPDPAVDRGRRNDPTAPSRLGSAARERQPRDESPLPRRSYNGNVWPRCWFRNRIARPSPPRTGPIVSGDALCGSPAWRRIGTALDRKRKLLLMVGAITAALLVQ